jgi:hypothetical protein
MSTWKNSELIFDTEDIYHISFYKLDGIPVRCIISMYDDFPVGVIFHILGHGDWIYFNSNSVASNSTIPRVLNQWNMYTAETSEETERMKTILSNVYDYAKNITYRMNKKYIF